MFDVPGCDVSCGNHSGLTTMNHIIVHHRVGPEGTYDSPWLPPWLKWRNGKELSGVPGPEDKSCEITVIAKYQTDEGEQRLEMTFPLTVSDPSREESMDSADEDDEEQEGEQIDDDGEME